MTSDKEPDLTYLSQFFPPTEAYRRNQEAHILRAIYEWHVARGYQLPFDTDTRSIVGFCLRSGITAQSLIWPMLELHSEKLDAEQYRLTFTRLLLTYYAKKDKDIDLGVMEAGERIGGVAHIVLKATDDMDLVTIAKQIVESLNVEVATPLEEVRLSRISGDTYAGYRGDDYYVVNREWSAHPETTAPLNGQWVLRNANTGVFIDSDQYRTDLAERNSFKL